MTTTAVAAERVEHEPPVVGLQHVVSDAAAMTKRNLLRYVRVPQLLVFSTIQPIMLILLFNYVFGGALTAETDIAYIDFVVPGILIQAVIFGSTQTGVGLVDDLQSGIIDRFRSLPMARSAVLSGRTLGDAVRNTFVVLLMIGIGTLLGFRFHNGFWFALCAVGLAVLTGLTFGWIQACIGLLIKDVETVQAASFVWVFPLVFASSAFVPVETMPGWLQAFAENQPLTKAIDGIRWLTQGAIPGGPAGTDVWAALAWMVGLLIVFVPITVQLYRRLQ